MKRIFTIAAGIAALGALAYFGSTLFIQTPTYGQAASVAGQRVALVNMYVVMKGYKKVEFYKQEIKRVAQPYETEIKKYQKNYKGWLAISKDITKSKEEREKAAKYARDFKRQIEDLGSEANKKIMTMGQQQVVAVYREIEETIQRYARANGIHLVLHYLDPTDESERYAARNIDRKLNGCSNAGACSPIYHDPSLDISQQVLQILNQQYPPTGGQK